eukprot:gene7420-6211_t
MSAEAGRQRRRRRAPAALSFSSLPRLNLAIAILPRIASARDVAEGRRWLDEALRLAPNDPKALLWDAIYAACARTRAPGIPGAIIAPGIPGAIVAPGIPGAIVAPGIPGAIVAPGIPGAIVAPGIPGAIVAPGIPGAIVAPGIPGAIVA